MGLRALRGPFPRLRVVPIGGVSTVNAGDALLDPSLPPGEGDAETLPRVLVELMRDIGMPDAIAAVGYAEATVEDLAGIFRDSLHLW